MKEYAKLWEPVDVTAIVAVIGILILLAMGIDSVLKGAFATTLGFCFKRALGKVAGVPKRKIGKPPRKRETI